MEVPESNFHAESISGKIRFNTKYNEKNEKEREKQNPTTKK